MTTTSSFVVFRVQQPCTLPSLIIIITTAIFFTTPLALLLTRPSRLVYFVSGMVRLRVGDLLPDGLTQKAYALVADEDKSTPGSLKLSVTFIEKAAKDSRKKVGFWRRLYSFLLGGRRNGPNDASDGETNDDQSNASASNSASGTPRESTDGAAAGADDSAVPSTIVIQDNQDEGASEGLLFGRPLAEILENQRERHADLSVPWFIWAAARSIREKGTTTTTTTTTTTK